MTEKRKLTAAETIAYGLGAVGKDMVYMLSASYVLYYFQDILGVSALAMGVILMAARIFDAFNDPVMGVIVAKTRTRWGKFRPWLLIGTLTNAVILFLMFSAPPSLDGKGLVAYAAVTYILWGVTYTMMDIPYWSMIPAFTEGGKERENLTTLARSCAGVGSAIITIGTVICVQKLGRMAGATGVNEIERAGFKYFALIVAIIFVAAILFTCTMKEKSTVDMETASVGQMFKALLANDQTLTVVIAIVLINSAMYITSNLVIYFFKYDFGGSGWYNSFTLFNAFGGAIQILSMMVLYKLFRMFRSNLQIFFICIGMEIIGYAVLLVLAFTSMSNVFILFFSMQTFVVKLASGVAALIAAACLQVFSLSSDAATEAEQTMDLSTTVPASSKVGLRMTMTILPIIGLIAAFFWFRKRYILTDEKIEEISAQLHK